MAAKVVPFKRPNSEPAEAPAPSLAELVARVRDLATDSDNIGFLHPHLQMRMEQRGLTMRQILETIRRGEGISGPKKDEYGDWRIKLRRKVAGRRVQVVVAVRENDFSVVTAI